MSAFSAYSISLLPSLQPSSDVWHSASFRKYLCYTFLLVCWKYRFCSTYLCEWGYNRSTNISTKHSCFVFLTTINATKTKIAWKTCMFIITIINLLTARVVGAPRMILQTSFLHFPLFSTALWDLPNSRPVHSLMLSSHLFLCLPCLLPPFTMPCKMVLARQIIPLQFASLYDRQKIFMWSNCLLDLGTDLLVGNMVFVWDV